LDIAFLEITGKTQNLVCVCKTRVPQPLVEKHVAEASNFVAFENYF